jgi:hypothetical protein
MTNPVRFSCEGITVGEIWIPPFQLRVGEVACLHMPSPRLVAEKDDLLKAFTGRRSLPGLHLHGKVEYAEPPPSRAGVLGFFRSSRPADLLRQSTGVSREEAARVVARLGLKPEWRVNQLAMNPKTLLGLEVAWARGADVVVFSTVGCDPLGVQTVFREVASRVKNGAGLYLCYPYLQDGQEHRDCFPGSLCVQLSRQTGSAAPLTSA